MNQTADEQLTSWLSLLENRHRQEVQLGLERVRQVADRMNLLHPGVPVITVAGTNGKGSTVACLEAIYQAGSFRVATYTSPHLLSFTERIKVNGQAIEAGQLVATFQLIEQARAETHLTYFETATLAALLFFKQQKADIIILEVGLGGRLDATNVIDADLAIITTIDFDHQDYLGHTLDAIGYEKAGILRTGRPFIYADTNPPPASVMAKADALTTQTHLNGRDFSYRDGEFCHGDIRLSVPETPLHANAVAAALMACLCLKPQRALTEEAMLQGIGKARISGRLECRQQERATLYDVAHNPQAARHLAHHLEQQYSGKTIHAVFSALGDKDLHELIAALRSRVAHWYPALLPGKRRASASQLEHALIANEVTDCLCYNDPVLAYQAACQQAKSDDLILVYGSFLTVAAVQKYSLEQP